MSGGIWCEREMAYGISIDFVIELDEDTEASICKGGMGRLGEDVIVRKTFFGLCESFRCQELFDREMCELYYLADPLIDDGDQTGACG